MSKITGFTYSQTISGLSLLTAMYIENSFHNPGTNNCYFADDWVLDYSCSCLGEFKVAGLDWLPRKAMTAHLYPPGTIYREHYCGESGTNCYFIFHGDCDFLRNLADNPAGFAEIADPRGVLLKFIKEGAEAAASGQSGYWRSCMSFAAAMDVLVNHVRREEASWRFRVDSAGRAAGYCRKALDFMEKNYMSTLSVKDIASASGCSESTLAHEFKKEYHETVMNRLQKIRIEQSLPHLLHGVNIQEAAELSGFSNEFYYSRVFRRIMGVPPGVYRSTKDII